MHVLAVLWESDPTWPHCAAAAVHLVELQGRLQSDFRTLRLGQVSVDPLKRPLIISGGWHIAWRTWRYREEHLIASLFEGPRVVRHDRVTTGAPVQHARRGRRWGSAVCVSTSRPMPAAARPVLPPGAVLPDRDDTLAACDDEAALRSLRDILHPRPESEQQTRIRFGFQSCLYCIYLTGANSLPFVMWIWIVTFYCLLLVRKYWIVKMSR